MHGIFQFMSSRIEKSVVIRHNKLVNQEFYYAVAEYFLAYIDNEDKKNVLPICNTPSGF